jgi:hypothetical protein
LKSDSKIQENAVERKTIPSDVLSYLNTYFNGSIFSKYDLILSMLFPVIPYMRYTKDTTQKIRNFQKNIPKENVPELTVQIEPYRGKNEFVHKMIEYLDESLKEDLVGAYVHGSLGTYEEILYSDFDALVIIKNKCFETAKDVRRVAQKLSKARSIMYNFDHLQHHGWFVLAEAHLHFYPQYFFPVELFQFAKSLFTDRGLELKIRIQRSWEMGKKRFYDLGNSILKALQNKDYPNNMYQLKGLLSRFMLMPSFYVQMRDRKGVFKKLSFNEARVDFSEEDWAIMDDVSSLRENWHYDISSFRRWFMTRSRPVFRFLVKKCAPAIPDKMKNILSIDFYDRMIHLIKKMQGNLE